MQERPLNNLIEIKAFKTNKCDINFQIDNLLISPSKIYALLGLSGHGKSLLLSLLAGYPNRQWLKKLSFDKFDFFGEAFLESDFHRINKLAKKFSSMSGKIIYMPQTLPSDKTNNLSIKIELPLLLKAIDSSITKPEVDLVIDTIQEKISKDILSKTINKLSGGERKRLEILVRIYGAKFFCEKNKNRGSIILLDEPTSGLDVKSEKLFMAFIRDIFDELSSNSNLSIIIASHSIHLLEAKYNFFDKQIIMQKEKNTCHLKVYNKEDLYKKLDDIFFN